MDLIFLAYANDAQSPLTYLKEEDQAVYKDLFGGAMQQHYLLHRESYASLDSVADFLSRYRKHLVWFHFSGHAGRDQLLLDQQEARAEGIAHLLSQCPKLKGVFLNGCSTYGQVEKLLELNIPIVLATSAPVEDDLAAKFAMRFYKALADQETVEQAFELAKGEVLAQREIQLSLYRGLMNYTGSKGKEAATWGLFVNEKVENALDWKLPNRTQFAIADSYEPNKYLIAELLAALAPYRTDVESILDEESMGVEKSILDKRDAILTSFPHPISEQLRKLVVSAGHDEKQRFYDKAGLDRLSQLIHTYTTSLEFMALMMLAQLWEFLHEDPQKEFSQSSAQEIGKFFQLDPTSRKKYQMLDLIKALYEALNTFDKAPFISELQSLDLFREASGEFDEAIVYLENLKEKLQSHQLSDNEAAAYCPFAEEKLAAFLRELAFLARYNLASVKEVGVLKYRHFPKPIYKHKLVNLVLRLGGLAEDQEIKSELLDCSSVLMMRNETNPTSYLNLSPFVIDENAFDEKATLAKLHYFYAYHAGQKSYVYKHIYKPEDLPLLVNRKKKYYKIIGDQFGPFKSWMLA